MAVTLDGSVGHNRISAVQSTVPITQTIGSNSNRVLVALIGNDATLTLNSVGGGEDGTHTWTQVSGGPITNGVYFMTAYFLINPNTGSQTVTATFSGNLSSASDGWMALYSLFGAAQSATVDGFQSGTGAGGHSVTVTSATGNMVLASITHSASPDPYTGAGAVDVTDVNNEFWRAASAAGAANVTMSWTAGSRIIIGVDVNAVAASTFIPYSSPYIEILAQ